MQYTARKEEVMVPTKVDFDNFDDLEKTKGPGFGGLLFGGLLISGRGFNIITSNRTVVWK